MLKKFVDILINGLGWGTAILIMAVSLVSFIIWACKGHPKTMKLLIFLLFMLIFVFLNVK